MMKKKREQSLQSRQPVFIYFARPRHTQMVITGQRRSNQNSKPATGDNSSNFQGEVASYGTSTSVRYSIQHQPHHCHKFKTKVGEVISLSLSDVAMTYGP
jgi:hypothetical protein